MTLEPVLPETPPARTRPRNRRELIIAAAAELFQRHGYDRVAVGDVAAAVNVRPSALYRHFPGKPQLLAAVILTELEPFQQAMTGVLEVALPDLVRAALDHQQLGVLWQREVRSLPDEERALVRERLRALAGLLTGALLTEHPALEPSDAELLSWCVWAVLHSVGHPSVELPTSEYASLLRQIVRTITTFTPRRAPAPEPASDTGFRPQARRERVLAAAVSLFAAQGYAGVSMEDIGARAGIAGPSIYHHFTAKTEILYAAIVRGDEWLRHDTYRALARAEDPGEALSRLIDSYVDFAADNSDFITILLTDVRHLPDEQRGRVTQSQRDYLGEWLYLLRRTRPLMPEMHARARLHATLAVINDLARTPHLRHLPGARTAVKQLGSLILLGPE
jgi:AcrR family transcriptional regulator